VTSLRIDLPPYRTPALALPQLLYYPNEGASPDIT